LGKVVRRIFAFGRFAVGSFGIFFSGSENKPLENAADFHRLASFSALFWYIDFLAIQPALMRILSTGGRSAGNILKHLRVTSPSFF